MLTTLDVVRFLRELGAEFKALRRRRGYNSRQRLCDALDADIVPQTLGTYEQGTRQIGIVRFVQLCLSLGESPHDLLARVCRRVITRVPGAWIRLDLRQVVANDNPALLPLRRWASAVLDHRSATTNTVTMVDLEYVAQERMAELCGLTMDDLISLLRRIGG